MTDIDFKVDIDYLKLYFEEPIKITDKIIMSQPHIGDIMSIGEKEYYSSLYSLIGNPTMFRLQLWKHGVDWNKISDFELFCIMCQSADFEVTKTIFGDIDFSKFKPQPYNEEEVILVNEEQEIVISEITYLEIVTYLRTMFGIFPKVEKAKGKTTKEWMIEEEEEKLKANKDKPYQSTLLPLISSCLNHPGFKYKKTELKDVGIYEFMDSVSRLQVYESTTALLKGIYSGFVDSSKIQNENLNFMRDLNA